VAEEIRSPADAFDWLAAAADAVPAEDLAQRLALGKAWQRLSMRRPGPECLARARSALAPLFVAPHPPPRALMAMAAVLEQEENLPAAEAAYRQVLNLPTGEDLALVRPLANNNLANLISLRTSDIEELEEAQRLAAQATAAKSNVAAFHDTLAAIYSKRHHYGRAITEWRLAVKLQPAPRYRLRLAQALADSGDTAAARQLARDVDREIAADHAKKQTLSESEQSQLLQLTKLPDRKPPAPASTSVHEFPGR
jgi:tetratricopeptide (TPR) repeat protein